MKTGIFGGAFNPFHIEHRKIIECAKNALDLDKVVVLPSFCPPHKDYIDAGYEIRREMVLSGVAGLPYVIVDDLEKESGGINPTHETLPVLKKKYPGEKFYFIMGGDSAVNFPSWLHPERIAKEAALAVVGRAGCGDVGEAAEKIRALYDAEVEVLSYVGGAASASVIRAETALGERSEYLLPETYEIVKKYNLYREFDGTVEKLKENITAKTYEHSASTVLYAQKFTGLLNLSYEKVFLSALLHDCGKGTRVTLEGVPNSVVHQFIGAELARDVYGVTDAETLGAVRYHTTGRPNMTNLEKLIFCADMLERRRDFPGVEILRRKLESDFDEGFAACVKNSLDNLAAAGKPVYPLTYKCAEFYKII